MKITRNHHCHYPTAKRKIELTPHYQTPSTTDYAGLLIAKDQLLSAFEGLSGGALGSGRGTIHPAAAINLPASYFDWSLMGDRHAIFRGVQPPEAKLDLAAAIDLPASWFDRGPAPNPLRDFFAPKGHPLNQ